MDRGSMLKLVGGCSGCCLVALAVATLGLSSCVSFGMKPDAARAYLRGRSVVPRPASHQHEHRTISWVETGQQDGPTVLLVHGSPGTWDAFIEMLADPELGARARLVSVDRPGFGGSGRGRAERSLKTQAAALVPILERAARPGPAILVGHSYAGAVIACLAMDRPELVAGLILVAPSIDPELETVRWFQVVADWRLVSWLVPTDLVTSNREILPLRHQLEQMLPLWSEIRAPVTVIQGGADRLVPPGNADFAAEHLINAEVRLMIEPELNHFIPWTRPDLVKQAILEQLELLEQHESEALISSPGPRAPGRARPLSGPGLPASRR